MSFIEFREVSKFFGDFQILRHIDFFESPEDERTRRFLNQTVH